MKEKKIYHVALIAIFIIVLWTPNLKFIADIFIVQNTVIRDELAALSAGSRSLSAVAREFIKLYENRFGFRQNLIDVYMYSAKKIFRKPFIKGVLISRDDWLYLADKGADEDYRVVEPFAESELDGYTKMLRERARYCKEHGIRYYYVLSPNKSTIYPEMLPSWYRPIEKTSHMDRFAERVKKYPEICFIDMREGLRELKKRYLIYYTTDTHWNDVGGFLAYQLITKKIRESFPLVPMMQWNDFTMYKAVKTEGDLAVMLDEGTSMKETALALKYNKNYRAKNVPLDSFYKEILGPFNPVRLFIMETGNKNLPNAVVFRDSFFFAVTGYLAENFNRVVYIWPTRFYKDMFFDKTIIEHENPDIVITEIVERGLPLDVRIDKFVQDAGMPQH